MNRTRAGVFCGFDGLNRLRAGQARMRLPGSASISIPVRDSKLNGRGLGHSRRERAARENHSANRMVLISLNHR
jgi:hypothetical protein